MYSIKRRMGIRNIYFFILVISGLFGSNGMQYQEPVNIEELHYYFDEDWCIEGTLSVTEDGGPVLQSNTEFSYVIKSSVANSTENDPDDKSSMSSVHELADFNKIKYEYTLAEEAGPPHKKRFFIRLQLGEEQYSAEGNSMKKAQHAAARLALNSTLYQRPPKKTKTEKMTFNNKTPVQKLQAWANKRSASLRYDFTEKSSCNSKENKNWFHKDMYSKPVNTHKVIAKVGEHEFAGEGLSEELAKQSAAKYALEKLQKAEGFCMFEDSLKSVVSRLFSSDPIDAISTVYEFASKSKMKVSFDVAREEGFSHLKKFILKCTVGDSFETFGEGSTKKSAKKEAALAMINKLKSHLSQAPVECGALPKLKSKKTKRRNIVKDASSKPYSKDHIELSFPDDLNPISKLYQIQQAKHEVEPVFTVLEPKELSSKEFFIEVTIGEISVIGSGRNKKAAKRKAAQEMLEILGYSPIPRDKMYSSSSHTKKREFVSDKTASNIKQLAPGININSDSFFRVENENTHKKSKYTSDSKLKSSHSSDHTKFEQNGSKKNGKSSSTSKNHKEELKNLSKQLKFRFQFSDFPKSDDGGFISLVSLTTDPPKVCYGVGEGVDISQNNAALSALQVLYKHQLDSVSQLLRKLPSDDHDLTEQMNTDKVVEVKTFIKES